MASNDLNNAPMEPLRPTTRDQLLADETVLEGLFESSPNLQVFTRSNPQYESVRHLFNTRFTQQPLAVVRPKTAAEISAFVSFAAAHSIPFGIRNRGHDLAGRALSGDDGDTEAASTFLLLDTRSLDAISVSEDKTWARVGGGVVSSELSTFLQERGLVTPTGWCVGVGYAGWALGGGYGFLSSKVGLGVDHVLGATVVLADGAIVDTDDHPELLWALRGAGNGTFGVVAELRIKIHPSPTILAGLLAFAWDDASSVISKFGELQDQGFPDNYAAEVMGVEIPGVGPTFCVFFAWIPDEFIGGDLQPGYEYLEKLKAIGTPVLDTIAETNLNDFQNSLPALPDSHWFLHSRNLDGYSQGVADTLSKFAPGGLSVLVMHSIHGAAARPNLETSFPLRSQHRSFHTVGNPETGVREAWGAEAVAALDAGGFSIPSSYGNLTPSDEFDIVATYGLERLEKLREIKRRYDPRNVFSRGYPRLA